MTRPEITAELSAMLEKKINPHNDPRIYWAKEVTFDYSTDHAVRVDYMRFVPVNNSVSGIEKGDFYCYEIKSSAEDFRSGHGLNFVGDYNYLVMPTDVCAAVSLEIPHYVGIYVPEANDLTCIKSVVNGAISKVNGVVSAIESAFSFGPWKVPTPFGSKTIGFKATFPRVPTVPYLAKGAVIPPRSEFLAVLGDQKQGNNIETPEALLRKIVREETAGRQTGGGSYRFTAQINRRTLFDEMMKEAQMRRDTSGRNPFEMA